MGSSFTGSFGFRVWGLGFGVEWLGTPKGALGLASRLPLRNLRRRLRTLGFRFEGLGFSGFLGAP